MSNLSFFEIRSNFKTIYPYGKWHTNKFGNLRSITHWGKRLTKFTYEKGALAPWKVSDVFKKKNPIEKMRFQVQKD